MDTKEFYSILDIDSPKEFIYYDNYAAMIESEEDIPFGLLYDLFENADEEDLLNLTDNYFGELLEDVPDEEEDFYILIENIGMCLMGILKSADDEKISKFTEEIVKFREWFTARPELIVEDCETGERDELTVRQAITRYNAEAIMGDESRFYFDTMLDYDIDEYVYTINLGSEDDIDYDPDDDYQYRDEDDEESLLKENYIYDDY